MKASVAHGDAGNCADCQLPVVAGFPSCQTRFEELSALHFAKPMYFSVHRLFVDAYCLQHPDRGCISFKSLAAHLAHLCWSIERGGTRAVPHEAIRRWVERHPHLGKPPLPVLRCAVTIADVARASPAAHHEAVDRWARDIWDAYASLHAMPRIWVDQARRPEARGKGRRVAVNAVNAAMTFSAAGSTTSEA